MNRPVPLLRPLAWLAGLSTALAGLLRVGDQLPLPPWPAPDPTATWRWLERADPAVTAFAVVRVAAIVVVAWLLVSTTILVVGQLLRAPTLVTAADRITVPAARRLINHAVGAGLAVTLTGATIAAVAGPGTAAAATAPVGPDDGTGSPGTAPAAPPVLRGLPHAPVLVNLGPGTPPNGAPAEVAPPAPPMDPPPAAAATTEQAAPDRTAWADPGPLTSLPPVAPTDTGETAGTTGPGERDRDPDPHPAGGASTEATGGLDQHHHTIVAGDHLWGVAEATLAARWARSPEPAEIADYLHRLIEANRGVLAVPDEPDLVFPGQVFVLPDT